MAGAPSRPRQISVADNLWEVFATMAEESGNRVDALVNQAMFEMAVKLGYVTPVSRESAPPMEEGEVPEGRRTAASAAPGGKFAQGRTKDAVARRTTVPPGQTAAPSPGGAAPAPAATKRPPRPAPKPGTGGPAPAAAAKMDGKGLYIVNEDGDAEKIDKDIYIIGRSSKCDLVINSVKVSREHAIITRERGEYYIEDLGSANGTWYKGEKIEKMKIRDGDEIFICDEKFKFVVR